MSNKAILKLISLHRNWLDDNRDRIRDRELRYLEDAINQRTPQSMLSAATAADGLALCYGIEGIIRTFDGDIGGWAEIDRSVQYHLLTLRLESEAFFRRFSPAGLNLTNYTSRAACLICYGSVCGQNQWSRLAERILRRIADTKGAADEPYWSNRVLEPFVLACCDLRNGTCDVSHVAATDMGIYSDIFSSWNDSEHLRAALLAICDYHCEQMDDTGGDYDEFKYTPFDVIPCEVLFVRQIRESLGLGFPAVEHPLMQTPLAAVKSCRKEVDDPLLNRIESTFAEWLT
jgi:hypothetical protein